MVLLYAAAPYVQHDNDFLELVRDRPEFAQRLTIAILGNRVHQQPPPPTEQKTLPCAGRPECRTMGHVVWGPPGHQLQAPLRARDSTAQKACAGSAGAGQCRLELL